MKYLTSIIIAILVSSASFAQNVLLKNDTVYLDKSPVALFQKTASKPTLFFMTTLKGVRLVELHDARIDVNSQPGIVVTFLSDHKQAMITHNPDFPLSFVTEIVRTGFIASEPRINPNVEAEFIKAHPLPAGYIDVEQLMDNPVNPGREIQLRQPE